MVVNTVHFNPNPGQFFSFRFQTEEKKFQHNQLDCDVSVGVSRRGKHEFDLLIIRLVIPVPQGVSYTETSRRLIDLWHDIPRLYRKIAGCEN